MNAVTRTRTSHGEIPPCRIEHSILRSIFFASSPTSRTSSQVRRNTRTHMYVASQKLGTRGSNSTSSRSRNARAQRCRNAAVAAPARASLLTFVELPYSSTKKNDFNFESFTKNRLQPSCTLRARLPPRPRRIEAPRSSGRSARTRNIEQ